MNRARLFIVDDHPALSAGVARILAAAPEIEVVGDAQDGVTAVRRIIELAPDLVLLDMKLPQLSGCDVARQVRASAPQVKIIAFSGFAEPGDVQQMLALGAVGYLTKDEPRERILEAIRSIAAGESGWLSRTAASVVMALQQEQRAQEQCARTKAQLTAREREVLAQLAQGCDNEQIAAKLRISSGTVKNHVLSILAKLGVHSRAEAVAWAWRNDMHHTS